MDDMWKGIPLNAPNQNQQASGSFNLIAEAQSDPRPSQIDFAAWFDRATHPRDYDDAYFNENFTILYDRTVQFVRRWFDADVNFSQYIGANNSGWGAPLTEQFIQYSRLVAHEDRPRKTWASIINEPDQRRWLVVGILSQIMEKKIFNELLFGATPFYKEELERSDMLWIRKEGYNRKEGRANIVRGALEGTLIPGDFWNAVDDLTGQTALIFRPLLDLMRALRGQDGWRRQAVFWQELHVLIAFAGYLQVCTAISPSVFHFLSATPGSRMDYSMEKQADMPMYRDSKVWHEKRDNRYEKGLKALAKGQHVNVAELQQISGVNELPTTKQERNVDRYHRTRGAKIKFAVFPKVTRYRPENVGADYEDDEEPLTTEDMEKLEGQCIVDITRCIVVYYQGLIYPRPGQTDGIPLQTHLNEVALKTPWLGIPTVLGLKRQWDWQGSWTWHWVQSSSVADGIRRVTPSQSRARDFLLYLLLIIVIAVLITPEPSELGRNDPNRSRLANAGINFVQNVRYIASGNATLPRRA
ncbi:hypothetical protein F4809DRAFT_600598 [Biscogniauxia mediterranea]|nr:hypothetical protein F4809DRAFT_600598 [Biscogniauxia mediterranea]